MRESQKINWTLITGLIIIIFNLFWIWDNLHLLYLYHSSGMLFVFMYPDWVLFFNSGLGIIGVLIGIGIIKMKTKIKYGILIDLLILVTGGLTKLILIM